MLFLSHCVKMFLVLWYTISPCQDADIYGHDPLWCDFEEHWLDFTRTDSWGDDRLVGCKGKTLIERSLCCTS